MNRLKMAQKTGLIAIAVIAIVIIAAAAYLVTQPEAAPGEEEEEEEEEEEKLRAAMVMHATINDYCWGASGWVGLQAIRDELGFEIDYSEGVAVADFERVIREYAAEGYDIIFGHDFATGDPLRAVAEDYPETAFAWADGYLVLPNQAVYAALAHEAAYLAGMLAAGMSETGTIGAQGGNPVPDVVRVIEAYKLGATVINPDIEILTTYIGTWDDVGKSKEAALAMIDAGADVLLHGSSTAGLGAIEAGESRGILIIGDTQDQNALAPDTVITSVLMNFKAPMLNIAEDVIAGTFEGGFYDAALPDGGTEIAPYHGFEDVIPDDLKALIDQARDDIIAGDLVVPNIEEIPD